MTNHWKAQFFLIAAALGTLVAQSPEPKPAFPGQTDAPAAPASAPFQTQVVTERLNAPWSLAFLPDGTFLVTENGGAMAGQHLARLVLDGDKVVAQEKLLADRNWRIREVKQAPDGSIYLFAGNRLVRLAPR